MASKGWVKTVSLSNAYFRAVRVEQYRTNQHTCKFCGPLRHDRLKQAIDRRAMTDVGVI